MYGIVVAKKLENMLSEYYKVSSYSEFCIDDDDEDGYYCKEFVDSLHEILGETIEILANMLGLDAENPDALFKKLTDLLEIENYSELYWEIMDTHLEMRYGRVDGYKGTNWHDIAVRVEDMFTTLASIEYEE
jgi:hypothetical protein